MKKNNTKFQVEKLQNITGGLRTQLGTMTSRMNRDFIRERIKLPRELRIESENLEVEANKIKRIMEQLARKNRLQGPSNGK